MKYIALIICMHLLSGCGGYIKSTYYSLESNQGRPLNFKPSKCDGPSSSIYFDLPDGAKISVNSWSGPVNVEALIKKGDSFRFVSDVIAVSDGWPLGVPAPRIGAFDNEYPSTSLIFSNYKHSGFYRSDVEVKLPAGYQNDEVWPNKLTPSSEFKEFWLKLPDAYYNEKLVSFPEVKFSLKEIKHYHSACWK
jgi:hypothetical protein